MRIRYETESPRTVTMLALRLSVPSMAGEAIDEIVAAYRAKRTLPRTAKALGVAHRTLARWIERTPELQRRLDAVRVERRQEK